MAVDPAHVGRTFGGQTLLVTRSRLRFFAKATGQTDPIYMDVDAAKQAGHRDLPVPPTFFMSVELEDPDPFKWMAELGIDLRSVLHGEQSFTYRRMAYAGDELTTASTLTDVYEKRGGALQFIVRATSVSNQNGEAVAEITNTTVVRQLQLT